MTENENLIAKFRTKNLEELLQKIKEWVIQDKWDRFTMHYRKGNFGLYAYEPKQNSNKDAILRDIVNIQSQLVNEIKDIKNRLNNME